MKLLGLLLTNFDMLGNSDKVSRPFLTSRSSIREEHVPLLGCFFFKATPKKRLYFFKIFVTLTLSHKDRFGENFYLKEYPSSWPTDKKKISVPIGIVMLNLSDASSPFA